MSGERADHGDFLVRMAVASHRRLDQALAARSERELRRQVAALPPAPAPRFTTDAFHLIAEVKRRSPSAGQLAGAALAPAEQARSYVQGGAIAISVLTEPEHFSGSLADLGAVTAALPGFPVMRKDFLVGSYQVLEARAAGAAGVLLIAAILEPEQLQAMIVAALDLGLFVLVEVFDSADLDRCVPAVRSAAATEAGKGRVLLGVNCRNLRTLEVDRARFAELAPRLPRDVPWVAESGIETPAQAAEVAHLGYRLILVGTSLMRSPDPASAARALLEAGRRAVARA
jgi:indole-3-glycerol phosphate synthase